MSRILTFVVFFSLVVSLVGGAHYYLWARLVRDPGLPAGFAQFFGWALLLLFLSIPTSLFLRRSTLANTFEPLVWVAMTWLGFLFFLVLTVATTDLLRGLWQLARSLGDAPPLVPDRRQALARIFAGLGALAGATLGGVAARSGLGRVALRHVDVTLARLPASLNGTRIVQLSDVHVGPTIHRGFIERIVAQCNALEPDVVAITGDLVDGTVSDLAAHVAPLAGLRAKYGVFFVTGNHEYYSGAEEWCQELTRLGIRVLRNERVSIGAGTESFDLAGVDDHSSHSFGNGHGEDLDKALAGRDPTRELVLLAHQPRAIFKAQDMGVGLQLSGHTHGGQMWPWTYMVRLQQPVVAGLAKFKDTLIYVSCGTGYWGPPMRLGAPSEITSLVLRGRPAVS